MRLLLDTCTAIWIGIRPERVSERARLLLEDIDHDLYLSVLSYWEIELKHFSGGFDHSSLFLDEICHELFVDRLTIEPTAIRHSTELPRIHSDPFDRLLIAQAITEDMILVTPDEEISRYPVATIW